VGGVHPIAVGPLASALLHRDYGLLPRSKCFDILRKISNLKDVLANPVPLEA